MFSSLAMALAVLLQGCNQRSDFICHKFEGDECWRAKSEVSAVCCGDNGDALPDACSADDKKSIEHAQGVSPHCCADAASCADSERQKFKPLRLGGSVASTVAV